MKPLARERWDKLWGDPPQPATVTGWYNQLAARYSEPHRHYHNAQHIAECLSEFDGVRALARQPMSVELAIWFHDAIYDPRRSDNEEQSAALAGQCADQLGLDGKARASLGNLILATKQHDSGLDPDAALLVDIDLSILGQPPERFWRYEEQIRQEYSWVPQPVFAEKRVEILQRFLSRPTLYHKDIFRRRYEQQARANLEASIKQLLRT